MLLCPQCHKLIDRVSTRPGQERVEVDELQACAHGQVRAPVLAVMPPIVVVARDAELRAVTRHFAGRGMPPMIRAQRSGPPLNAVSTSVSARGGARRCADAADVATSNLVL